MNNDNLTPAIMAEFEKISKYGVGIGVSYTPPEDQSQALFVAIMDSTNRYHRQFWSDPEPKRLWSILRTMVKDDMRMGTCEKDAVPGLSGRPDALARQHGYKSRRCLEAEKKIKTINAQIEQKENLLSLAKANLDRLEKLENLEKAKKLPTTLDRPLRHRHIRSPYASIKPPASIKKDSKIQEEKKRTLDTMSRLYIQLDELKAMRTRELDVISKFTSDSPSFALNIIPSGNCVVAKSGGKYTMLSMSTDGVPLQDMLHEELCNAIDTILQGLYERRPQYKDIYAWIVDDMADCNAVYSSQGRRLKQSRYSRQQAADLLGIDLQHYITRRKEVKRWLDAHKEELRSFMG